MVSYNIGRGVVSYYYTINWHIDKDMIDKLVKGYTSTGKKVYYMKLYDDDGKMIAGNWKLCKDIVFEYDEAHPGQHYKIKKNTVKRLAKKYNITYDDVVKNVEMLSGITL